MINFDSIPKEKPAGFKVPEPGFHKVTIAKVTEEVSKAGNDYLQLQLKTEDGAIVFDNIVDSTAPALQWKLGRLVTACKLPLSGELTLSDLGKVILNKEIVADIKVIEDDYKKDGSMKAEVDIFTNDIFYPIEEYADLVGAEPSSETPQNQSY